MREKKNPVREIGLFTSIVFLSGAVLMFILFLLRGWGFRTSISDPYVLIQLGAALVFFISSRSDKLYFIQPIIFLVIAPINFLDSHDSFYGLGFFVIAVLLLFKIGFFQRRRILKMVGLLVYLYGWELFATLRSGRSRGLSLTPVFFVTVFLAYLYILYREKIIVYLKEPKPVLDLKAKGLSETERIYIQALDKGESPKEIAAEHNVSASTVRNTLARAYKKLGVKDKSELTSLTAKHTLKSE